MSGSDEPVDVLRERVERQTHALEDAVRDLGRATQRSLEPARWIRERPLACVTSALVFGLWLGAKGGDDRRPRRRWAR